MTCLLQAGLFSVQQLLLFCPTALTFFSSVVTCFPFVVLQAIKWMRENNKHMVLDADGLYIVTKNLDLVKGYKNCILTPNKNEFARLAKELDVDLEDKDRFDACKLLLLRHLPRTLQTECCSF